MTKIVTSSFIAKMNQNQAQKVGNKVKPLFLERLFIIPRAFGMTNKASLFLIVFERDTLPLHAHENKMIW